MNINNKLKMKIKVEFSGGLELMFNNQKNLDIDLVEGTIEEGGITPTKELLLEDVIEELRKNHLKEKEEMFIQAGTVRPGIIVLVNDTDWELLDSEKYKMQSNDTVAFISTLHGGWTFIASLHKQNNIKN